MTQKTRSLLIAEANTNLPDNTTQQISPADVRNLVKDILDSYISNSGDIGIAGLLQYSNTFSITDDRQLVYMGALKNLLTVANGLTKTGLNTEIGGTFTQDTAIDGNFNFALGPTDPLASFAVTTTIQAILSAILGTDESGVIVTPGSVEIVYTSSATGEQDTINVQGGGTVIQYILGSATTTLAVTGSGIGIQTIPGSPYISNIKADNITSNTTTQMANDNGTMALISSGFFYWKGTSINPASGDIREGMIGSDLCLQEFNGTSWATRSTR